MSVRAPLLLVAAFAVSASVSACGEDELPAVTQRGVPGGAKKKKKSGKASRRSGRAAGDASGDEPELDVGPSRPSPTLDSTSFARRRDPFQGFVSIDPVEPEPDPVRADRRVELRKYSFEDLKLTTIVNPRRPGVRSMAMFEAGDGFSGTVREGQYFSSAEVLLVAVNQDYVEVEVVDEQLASSLGMQRGERRALYLRNE